MGIATAACSSSAVQSFQEAVSAEVSDPESMSSEPVALPLVDDDTTTTSVVEPETTTTSAAPTTTSTTEPPADEIVYSEDPSVAYVRVNSGDDSLNVRSAPGQDASVIGQLAPVTWYVETTGNIASLGDSEWREVKLPSGGQGWVSANFVQQITPTCNDITVSNPIESTTWDGNLDGDGLTDVVNYVRLQDETMHIRVEFGNGATTATQVGVSTDVPFLEQGWVVSKDFNGDGYEEIEFSMQFSGDTSTQIISMNGCDFILEGVSFGTAASAAGRHFWNCTGFGTSDVKLWSGFRTVDGVTAATGHSFTPATGFTPTGEEVTLTDEEAGEFFDLLCSNDYD